MDNIRVGVPKDIAEYHEKFFGFTIRQIFFGGLGVAVVLIISLVIGKYIPDKVSKILAIAAGAPLFLMGFLTYNNMPFEKIIRLIFRQEFDLYKDIKYESDDEYNIRKWYYSHLTSWVSFKKNFSQKMKIRVDVYFEKAKPTLIEYMHEGKLPKKIKPPKLSRAEYKKIIAEQKKKREEEKAQREKEQEIKIRSDKKKQEINDNIANKVNSSSKSDKPMEKRKKLSDAQKQELFDDIFGDMF